jgi:hypothetical protein
MAVTLECLGGLGVGVGVEKTIEGGQGVGIGLAGLSATERDGDRKAGGRSTTKAHVEVDLFRLDNGDVLDEEPGDPLALPDGRGRV